MSCPLRRWGVMELAFQPKVTDLGQRHPVTTGLPQAGDPGKEPDWGRWFRSGPPRAPSMVTTVLLGSQ